MAATLGEYIQRVLTQQALELFERQARELGTKVRLRLITRGQAVDILKDKSTYNQIILRCGPERAEQIMAEHLNEEVLS